MNVHAFKRSSRPAPRRSFTDFAEGWDWERVFDTWINRLHVLGIDIAPLFARVEVTDPAVPGGRPQQLSWWPEGRQDEWRQNLQDWLDRHPGDRGPLHGGQDLPEGEMQTLQFLWDHRDSPAAVAAILIAASLFPMLHASELQSSGGRFPSGAAELLDEWARANWPGVRGLGWHYDAQRVLPMPEFESRYLIESMDDFVHYLADEHVEILAAWRPVVIEFVPPPQAAAGGQPAPAAASEAPAAESDALSRTRDLATISRDEFQRLVWSMPMIAIAKQLGVSDHTIAKRCVQFGIPKPPRTFWQDVRSGKRPHPEGVPPADLIDAPETANAD